MKVRYAFIEKDSYLRVDTKEELDKSSLWVSNILYKSGPPGKEKCFPNEYVMQILAIGLAAHCGSILVFEHTKDEISRFGDTVCVELMAYLQQYFYPREFFFSERKIADKPRLFQTDTAYCRIMTFKKKNKKEIPYNPKQIAKADPLVF